MHYGVVTAVEIGDIKKEIVFHGDVLNTSSRIQNLCKKYGKDLLVSGNMVHRISGSDKYDIEFVDTVIPKGKSIEVDIFSIDCKGLKPACSSIHSIIESDLISSPILT
jgi:adenylate cyclase